MSNLMARHGDMDMDMDMGMDMPACKMKMYWNWYTIDACFLSEAWHITSKGMFAGSCIGVVLLVMTMEMVRRAQREYDRLIVRKWKEANATRAASPDDSDAASSESNKAAVGKKFMASVKLMSGSMAGPVFRPTFVQQLVRSLFYVVQFGCAYIVMLLVMYYNGYIFFCILIGALLGYFIFASDMITDGLGQEMTNSSGTCCC